MESNNEVSGVSAENLSTGLSTFVISLNAVPRNTELLSQLRLQRIEAELVEAADGRSGLDIFDTDVVDFNLFQSVLGRLPSGPEVGCALSHLACAQKAQDSNASLALVLEEDANVIGNLAPAMRTMRTMDQNRPTVLTLFAGVEPNLQKRTVREVGFGRSQIVGRLYKPPTFAVAYLMNRAAIDVFASESKVTGLADWPPRSYSIDFWAFYPWPVTHTLAGSAIENCRSRPAGRVVDHSVWGGAAVRYLALFHPGRVRNHSRVLGGLGVYIRRVIMPHAMHYITRLLSRRP